MIEPYFKELPYLGTLYWQATYIYFDEPILFLCTNERREKFLCLCAENRDEYRWIITEVCRTALVRMIRNETTAYEAFQRSGNWKYVIRWTGDENARENVARVKFDDISELDLPERTALLDIPSNLREKFIQQVSSIELNFSRLEPGYVTFRMSARSDLKYTHIWTEIEEHSRGFSSWNIQGRLSA